MTGIQPPTPLALDLGHALRRLNAAVLDPDLDDIRRADLLRVLEAAVRDLPEPSSRYTADEKETFRDGPGGKINPRGSHPFYGLAAGSGTPVDVAIVDDEVVLNTRFDVRHEGAPGWVHGGIIAAGFDIVLGRAASEFGVRGPTGTMNIRYRSPCPVAVDVLFRSWLVRREGRKSLVAAELCLTGSPEPRAEADAVFITPVQPST